MKPLYATYTVLTAGVFATGFLPFKAYCRLKGRHGDGLRERLGFIPRFDNDGDGASRRIWIHAASLGEIAAAEPIVKSLIKFKPGCNLLFSTITEHGRDLAMKTFGKKIPVFYAPIDNIFSVRKALSRSKPHVMVFLETELWPAWLTEAHRLGIRTAIVNGRISHRSVKRYLKLRPFFREVLSNVDAFSMILSGHADRIIRMGADPGKIRVNGNAKFDLLASRAGAGPSPEAEIRRILDLEPFQNTFIAGSTRGGEEGTVLDAYEKILAHDPELVLLIAPRHIDRTPEIESLLKARGHKHHLWTDLTQAGIKRTGRVIIVNTFGQLRRLYSIGTIIFCGASLVPLGGQNPLEAAIWEKVVLYGPSMEDFSDAKAMLEGVEAGMVVTDAEMLAEKALWVLKNPIPMKARGKNARKAILGNRGAAEKHARVIAGLL